MIQVDINQPARRLAIQHADVAVGAKILAQVRFGDALTLPPIAAGVLFARRNLNWPPAAADVPRAVSMAESVGIMPALIIW